MCAHAPGIRLTRSGIYSSKGLAPFNKHLLHINICADNYHSTGSVVIGYGPYLTYLCVTSTFASLKIFHFHSLLPFRITSQYAYTKRVTSIPAAIHFSDSNNFTSINHPLIGAYIAFNYVSQRQY